MLEPQQAADLLVLHSILVQRYSSSVNQRLQALLARVDADLFARLQAALEDAPGGLTAQAEYLQSVLESVRAMNASAYLQLQSAMQADMLGLAGVEVAFNGKLYSGMAGTMPLAAVGADAVYAAALARPFQGRLLSEVFPELGEARMRRMRDTIRIGFVSGKTTADIVRELRGTKAKGYIDGFVQLDRTHLDTVVHSALGHTAAVARDKFFEANSDAIGSQLWLSTIDSKVSHTCLVRSNLRYTTGEMPKPIGHSVPWGTGPGRIHYRCRSTAIGLLKGQERAYGVRSSSDGQIDAGTSYEDWMRRQVDFTQDEILGATRGRLFRDGGLKLDRFSDDKGRWLSLDDLKKRDTAAFQRAGIN